MEGTVKWFSSDKGYGFILVEGRRDDLFFHISEYRSAEQIQSGDKVQFEIGKGKNGREAAISVQFLAHAERKKNEKPFYGKPTRTKDGVSDKAGRFMWGAILGSALGPVGAVLGAAIGASDWSKEITSTCMRCGGTGQVTAIDEDFIGFQCENCKSFWRKRNKEHLTMSDVKRHD